MLADVDSLAEISLCFSDVSGFSLPERDSLTLVDSLVLVLSLNDAD